jgi:AraC-like DNA-binding protein
MVVQAIGGRGGPEADRKGAVMPEDDPYTQFVTVRAKPPPLTSGDTLYWDGMDALSRSVECTSVSEPVAPAAVPAPWPLAPDPRASPAVPTRDRCLLPSSPAFAIDWATEAACLTFYLDPGLLLPAVHNVTPGATGTLIWVHEQREETSITPTVHPALLVHAAYESLHVHYTELVPHLPRHDPLLHHMALVLQAAVEAVGVAGGLYAEALANALAVHLLRRYAISRQSLHEVTGGLAPFKLRRTTAYIKAHLEQVLSLAELAAVAQTSPAHFARLFKHATGLAPHRYVTTCRMERAKRLLAATDVSLSEIGLQVGCADQSHFTALFRKYVSTTPKAYRNTIRGTFL